ncbi:acylneuraminate cytidylyltransferase family protein [Thalassotalea fusca]
MQDKKILAIVPARAGSKRLPGKNSKLLNGKPLIEWTLSAAQQSQYIDQVLVTTDCQEIASLSESLGAWVPFLRPAELSCDHATTVDVVKHCLSFVTEQGVNYDYVIVLQPTSPLRGVKDIDAAIELMFERGGDAVVSVCPCEHPPQWANKLDESLRMDDFLSKFLKENARSQDLPTYYRLNGAIYLVDTNRFLQESNFYLSDNIYAYVMSQNHSVDIDNLVEFKLAEIMMSELNL